MNLGEYAEEATIIMDEPVRPAKHFIEANTQEVTLNHLNMSALPLVFSKDNELTINHAHLWKHTGCSPIILLVVRKVEQADIRE